MPLDVNSSSLTFCSKLLDRAAEAHQCCPNHFGLIVGFNGSLNERQGLLPPEFRLDTREADVCHDTLQPALPHGARRTPHCSQQGSLFDALTRSLTGGLRHRNLVHGEKPLTHTYQPMCATAFGYERCTRHWRSDLEARSRGSPLTG